MKYFAALALMAGLVAADGHLAGEAPQHAAAATTAAPQHAATTAAVKVEAPQHVSSAAPKVQSEAPKHVVVEAPKPAAASTHVVVEAPKHQTAAVASMSVAPGVHAGAANVHTVIVGGVKPAETGMAAILSYQPESIEAKKGDKVKFVFMQKNHTVTQSTFADPCKKMDGGMDSGFMPNAEGKSGVEWEMEVTTEEPLWFYCKQQAGFHCAKGMVFAINAAKSGDKTFSVWKQLAISKNGTQASLSAAPLASVGPNAAAKPSTVTVVANGGSHAAVTQAAGHSTAVAAAPSAAATIAHGVGKTGNGDACQCQCLCGQNSFPAAAAQGHFGGFAGMLKP